jgi:hypothetical protein
LLRDALYDQLLASLREGKNPPATEAEYWRYVREWAAARQGQQFPILDGHLPWQIERRQALIMLDAFPKDVFIQVHRVLHEATSTAEDEWERRRSIEPLNDSRLESEWRRWRNHLLQRYALEDCSGGIAPEGLEA